MSEIQFSETLRKRIQDAVRRTSERDVINLPNPVSAGDVFVVNEFSDIGLFLVLVQKSLDDGDIWYAVPADSNIGRIGSSDTEVLAADCSLGGPFALRCGAGLWLSVDELPIEDRVARINIKDIAYASERLSQIASSNCPTSPSFADVDDDPDYLYWIEEVLGAVGNLQFRLENGQKPQADASKEFVIRLADFTSDWQSQSHLMQRDVNVALAADSFGARKPVDGQLESRVDALVVPIKTIGELHLFHYDDGFECVLYLDAAIWKNTGEIPSILGKEIDTGCWTLQPDNTYIWSKMLSEPALKAGVEFAGKSIRLS